MQAATSAPSFAHRQRLVADDLMHLDEPCVLFEHFFCDSDGEPTYLYSVSGVLNGRRLEDGCTVGGEVMVIHADSRGQADETAISGLQTTINALHMEQINLRRARGAMDRLASVSKQERMDAALAPAVDKSDAFVADIDAIRPLIGDDILMAAGGAPN